MTDARLQSLERAHRTNPSDVEAEAAWLRERVRADLLAPERLELAAYCGHEAARIAAGHGCCPRHQALGRNPQEGALARLLCSESPLAGNDPLLAWVRGLERWGPEVMVRAAVAAGRVALDVHERRRGEICCCGSLSRSHGMGDGHGPVHACDYYKLVTCECTSEPDEEARAALVAAEAVMRGDEGADPYEHQRAWDEGWSALWRALPWVPAPWASPGARETEIMSAARLAGEQPVRTAIQQALVTWALGATA